MYRWPGNINPLPAQGYSVISVQQGRRYRFRIMNLSAELLFRLDIEGHTNFTVIEMDGIFTDPVVTDHVLIHAGQRYSIIVEMDQPIGNYIISIQTQLSPAPGPLNGVAILSYEGASDPTPLRTIVIFLSNSVEYT